MSLILTKHLPYFSRIQIGVGTCFLDFDGAMMLEKESNFLEVNVSLDSGRPSVLRICFFLAGSRALFTGPVSTDFSKC